MFQSTPDLINRENTANTRLILNRTLFQSTPDLINRENIVSICFKSNAGLFQSTPDLINRENEELLKMLRNQHQVSIHSRFN